MLELHEMSVNYHLRVSISIGWETGELSLPADAEGNPYQENISLNIAYVMEMTYNSDDADFTEQYNFEAITTGVVVCSIFIIGVVAVTGGFAAGAVITVQAAGTNVLTVLGSMGLLVPTPA